MKEQKQNNKNKNSKSRMTNVKHKSSDFNKVTVVVSKNLSAAINNCCKIYYSQQFLVVLFDFIDVYFKFVMVSSVVDAKYQKDGLNTKGRK